MDMAWLNGKVPADHLRETRPEYYRQIVAAAEAKDSAPDAPSDH